MPNFRRKAPTGIAATVVSYGAARLGLFAEKQGMIKLREMTEASLDRVVTPHCKQV